MLTATGNAIADDSRYTASVAAAHGLPASLGVLSVELPKEVRAASLKRQQLKVEWPRAPRLGTNSVKFVVTAPGVPPVQHWARVRLGERAEVLVAKRALKVGTIVSSADLALEMRTVAREHGWRASPSALVGSRVLQPTQPGTALSPKIIEAPAPVKRGQPVSVEINKGRMRVTTRGVLERQANLGNLVSVRLTTTRRVVRARLVAPRLAILLETP